jgi:fluoride exporter
MRIPLAIALGGAAGSLARYWLGSGLLAVSQTFPVGTLLINVTGSFLLGALLTGLPSYPPTALRAGLMIGVCGGFTTFSTFSGEVVALVERGALGRAGAYALASVLLSALATSGGMLLGRALAAR